MEIQDFNFRNKNVLVRCDFNVPVSGDIVLDDFRIRVAVPTIEYLVKNEARVILMSHFEDKGKVRGLKFLVPVLEKLLGKTIFFVEDYLETDAREKIEKIAGYGEIVLLENLRFHGGEKKNDEAFALKLSKLGDAFINDAFSVSHRKHASVVGVPKFLPSFKGFLLEKELNAFSVLLNNPERPFVTIIGGNKITAKTEAVVGAVNLSDFVLIGSKIGEIILHQKGVLKNRNIPNVKSLDSVISNDKIINPVDGVFLSSNGRGKTRIASIKDLGENENILDIGPLTINKFKNVVSQAKIILWSGVLGMCEDERFERGTKEIAKAITNNASSFNVVGGGDTVFFIRKYNLEKGFNLLSTGGSAMLSLLNGKDLPGVVALNNNYGN